MTNKSEITSRHKACNLKVEAITEHLAIDEDSPTSAATEDKPELVTLTLPLGEEDSQNGRTPAITLTIKPQNIAEFQDFVAFFADLQSEIAEEEKKIGHRTVYTHIQDLGGYWLTRSFQSGEYSSSIFHDYSDYPNDKTCDLKNTLEMSLKLLTKLVQGTIRQRTPMMDGQRALSDQESFDLFYYVSSYRGFYNFLPMGEVDNKTFGSELANFCERIFMQLALVQFITKQDWKRLYQAALYRAHERLLYIWAVNYGEREDTTVRLLRDQSLYTDTNSYRFSRPFAYERIDDLVQQVVAEEGKRLHSFMTMLYGTLAILSQRGLIVTASKEKALPKTDILKTLQSLWEVLMTSAAGQRGAGRQYSEDSNKLLAAKDEKIAELEQEVAKLEQQVVLMQAKDEKIAELEQQVTKLESQIPSGPKARIVDTHYRDLHVHHYFLEINDQANGVVQLIQFGVAVTDEGKIISQTEEEKA